MGSVHIQEELEDSLHEECGVFGIYDFDGNDIASTIYYGLFALQHRGQESCGIAVSDTNGPKGQVSVHKGMGLVNEVFTQEELQKFNELRAYRDSLQGVFNLECAKIKYIHKRQKELTKDK